MRLSEALDGVVLELYRCESDVWRARPSEPTDPAKAREIASWGLLLAVWWRQSPTSIRECGTCGEVSLAGKGAKRKCWHCREGEMAPLTPQFTKKRPRRRKVQISDETT